MRNYAVVTLIDIKFLIFESNSMLKDFVPLLKGIVIFVVTGGVICQAQTTETIFWDTAAIGDQSIAVVSLDIQKLLKVDVESGKKTKFLNYWKDQRNLPIEHLDQTQMIFGGEIGRGPDDSTHIKIVFREPRQLSAETIGKMTGYQLTEKEILGRPCFIGDFEGSWGGCIVDATNAVFGVKRKLPEIIADFSEPGILADDLKKVSGADATLVFHGGENAAQPFKSLTGPDPFQYLKLKLTIDRFIANFEWVNPLQELILKAKTGTLIVNFEDELVFNAEIKFQSPEEAEFHSQMVRAVLPVAVFAIKSSYSTKAVDQRQKEWEKLAKRFPKMPPWPMDGVHAEANTMNSFLPFLQTLEVTANEQTMRIECRQEGGSPEMLEAIITLYTNQMIRD